MRIELKDTHDLRLFKVHGELVRENHAEFLDEMKRLTADQPYVVLELWNLEFVDSAGVGALAALAAHMRGRGKPLWLHRMNPLVKRVLENTHVIELFRVSNCSQVIQEQVRMQAAKEAARA
jgi:anti-anti-sigma factor